MFLPQDKRIEFVFNTVNNWIDIDVENRSSEEILEWDEILD